MRSTIELARALPLDVVAEDDETLLLLQTWSASLPQGFGLGRPVPAPLSPELVGRIEERIPAALGTSGLTGARPWG